MGENNIVRDLDGSLYFQDPDKQGWTKWETRHPLPELTVDELPEDIPEVVKIQEPVELSAECIVPPDTAKLLADIVEAWERALPLILESYQILCGEILRIWEALVGVVDVSTIRAHIWAYRVHPEWVAILLRTKKGRTRKKYHDRILRSYAKEAKE